MTVVEFLKGRLDEWGQAAHYAGPGQWQRDGINSVEDADGRLVVYGDGPAPNSAQADHMVLHDPARVLAQVAAMRAIMERHESAARSLAAIEAMDDFNLNAHTVVKAVHDSTLAAVRHLATIWAGHDDYDPDWEDKP